MRPETNRFVLRASWLIAAALWAGSLWMWFDIREATAPSPAVSPPLAAAEPAASEAADTVETKPEPVFTRERSRTGSVAAAAPPKARAVCGLDAGDGRLRSEEEIQAYLDEQGRQGLARTVAALEQRSDAAALALRALLEVQRGMRTTAGACLPGADCSAQLQAAVLAAYQRAPQAVDGLLQAAQAASDPLTVQTALLVCDAQRGLPKGCAGLSPRRLTQLDADNAAAWLDLAAREPAAADEALYRASIATRWDTYTGRAITQADEALPAELTPPQRLTLVSDVMATLHAYGQGATFVAARLCSETAVRDANRAQVCERLARTMVERGRDMLEVGVGLGIAKRLPALNDALHEARERHRARSAVLAAAPPIDAAAACDAVRQQLQTVREMQLGGEVAYAQRALERSGLGVADWARRADAPATPAAGVAPGAAAASAVAAAPTLPTAR